MHAGQRLHTSRPTMVPSTISNSEQFGEDMHVSVPESVPNME